MWLKKNKSKPGNDDQASATANETDANETESQSEDGKSEALDVNSASKSAERMSVDDIIAWCRAHDGK